MARFQFRLKTLLAVREASRDERRVELAEAQAEDRELKERRTILERELAHQQALLRSGASPGRLDIDRLTTTHRYDMVLRRELHVLREQEQTLAAEIERRRETLVAADREVRVLEKLRARQHEQFAQEQLLVETKQLDEVAARATRHQES
jgi:flagellar protein FliJ